ncbi:MAG: TetR/AcrR family transcriptional regulator [Aquabacterium sp.]|nr:TetR/AcrR family transcriptional regulator [Aquabacterium sp.]
MSTPDHRTRVAAEKRERMRMRLIESALHVFAQKGADAAVIEDVIALAEVSRGTFYNYFRTNEELLAAVVKELGDELLVLVEAVVTQCKDPAERLACGLRMTLHTMRAHPLLAQFVARSGLSMATSNSLAMAYLPRDIQAAMASGRFNLGSVEVGLTLVLGTAHAAIVAMSLPQALSSSLPANYPEEVIFQLLLGLGMTKAQARKLVSTPITPVEFPEQALLARTRPDATLA